MPERLGRTTFRLPRTSYLVVLFVLFGVLPFALGGGTAGNVTAGPFLLLLLIPVAVVAFIARTATVIDDDGITVCALLGRRPMPWADLRGVSVQGSTVYAVLQDGSVRLPCVQPKTLSALAEAAGDHLPELRSPAIKQPPVRRRR